MTQNRWYNLSSVKDVLKCHFIASVMQEIVKENLRIWEIDINTSEKLLSWTQLSSFFFLKMANIILNEVWLDCWLSEEI